MWRSYFRPGRMDHGEDLLCDGSELFAVGRNNFGAAVMQETRPARPVSMLRRAAFAVLSLSCLPPRSLRSFIVLFTCPIFHGERRDRRIEGGHRGPARYADIYGVASALPLAVRAKISTASNRSSPPLENSSAACSTARCGLNSCPVRPWSLCAYPRRNGLAFRQARDVMTRARKQGKKTY